jgi:pimeloyl-ACP methyl ester carboxylesterase
MHNINLFDKINAACVGLITPEMPGLKQLRKQNGYNKNVPTFDKPFEMNLEHITIDGVKIRIAHSSAGLDKPTIVLLSAFPHSILAYSPIWENLKHDFNLYAYDLPGFGDSQTDTKYMTFDFQGDFLRSFLQHFNIEESHLVAPDVGMPSALNYIGRHTNTIKSLMIGDGPAVVPSVNGSVIKKMTRSPFWRTMFTIAGSGALIESSTNLCNIKYTPNKHEVSDFKRSYTGKVGNNMNWFKQYDQNLPALDALLGTIQTPTKIFWGKHDAIISSKNGVKIKEKIPHSELEIFENSGHFVYQDEHEQFAEMVRTWVTTHK